MADYGAVKAVGDWEPSVKYLLVLIIAEVLLVSVLRALTVHGG